MGRKERKSVKPEPQSSSGIVLYQTEDGRTRLEVRLENDTVWLTQKLMAELFQKDVRTINEHIQNIFSEGELSPEAVIRKFRITAADGKSYDTQHYNLDVIISVGYRVKSPRGTQFRIWATQRLREYVVKGFVLDDERLKNPGPGRPDYFDELLERIRDIRASERRMYLRVREILALAADYQPDDEQTQVIFQTVQNKLHFAVSGKTAPELIAERADAAKPNMGLTTWKGAVVRKGDVTVAKNYLGEGEITELNRVVTMFLDYAEDQASRRKQVFMRDWREKLDEFLHFNERAVLGHAGTVTRENADKRAHEQYGLFEQRRRMELEAEGEVKLTADLKALEGKARELSKPRKKGKGPGKA